MAKQPSTGAHGGANPSSRQEMFPVGIPGAEMKTSARTIPADDPPPLMVNEKLSVIGKPTPRLDGRLKVTGQAKYTADIKLPGMLYGALVTATVPHARIKSIDSTAAARFPGVKAVYIIETLRGAAKSKADSRPAEYPLVRFAGQPLAGVAAVSQSAADAAARLMKVEYEPMPFVVDIEKARQPAAPVIFAAPAEQASTAGGGGGPRGVPQKGNVRGPSISGSKGADIAAAFAGADVVVAADYRTQVQTHSALETHGVVADFKPELLTVYASTQGTNSVRDELATVFGLPRSRVRVITEFMGGGFGAKFGAGNFGVIATHLSKAASAPVRLMLTRQEEHLSVGNRPSSVQNIRIGAKNDGTLLAIHATGYGTAGVGTGAGFARLMHQMYPCPIVVTEESDVFINAGPAAAFRAPGHPQGCFGFEQTIDDLAHRLKIDPLVLRDKIEVGTERSDSHRLQRRLGADRIGWAKRHAPGTDAGPVKRGMGMAQGIWYRFSNTGSACQVRISRDGSVELMSSVQDIGTGIRTALAQVVAEELGLRPADVTIKIGDTTYPAGPASGGSVTTNSITPPARDAAYRARQQLFQQIAATLNASPESLVAAGGKIFSRDNPQKGISFKGACRKMQGDEISVQARRGDEYKTADGKGIGGALAGAQFAEVAVDIETGVIQVERIVAAHDCGRPINPLAVESQINGGVIQGISYALFEDRILDQATGIMVNPNLDQYKIAGSMDTPVIEPILIEEYWGRSATDAAGIGEPATVPTAAAVANAVFNAIGVRVRQIPMTPRTVLAALAAAGGEAKS